MADTEKQERQMKRYPAILLFAIFFVSGTQAGNLGRLFFTPEQRAQLEDNHARNETGEGDSSSVLTINGIVQQHNGPRTVWINGAAQNSVHGGESASEAVVVPGKSLPIPIKVGEKLLLGFPHTAAPQSSPASTE
jgi:hypothetical protein